MNDDSIDQCTFNKTGKQFLIQEWYHCITCYPFDSNKGCCEACKRICHKGHQLEYLGMQQCFCDCGSGDCPIKCKCIISNSQNDLNENDFITTAPPTINTEEVNDSKEPKNETEIKPKVLEKNVETKKETIVNIKPKNNPTLIKKSTNKIPSKKKRFRLYV